MYMHAQAPMYVLSHSDTLTHKDIHSHAEAVGSRICICKSTHVLYTHPQIGRASCRERVYHDV